MRYRRFGTSDLEVSEVGFGTWTLASNWWGEVEDKRGMLDAALHAGITFFDTAPVYGEDGLGETLMADFLKAHRDEVVLTTKCGYDLSADARRPAAAPVLRLAARCQHLERWLVPRASYPEGKAGYLQWRTGLYRKQAARARELLLAAGAKDMRFALPNARVMVHQPSGGFQGQVTDILIHAREVEGLRKRLNEIYVRHTGRSMKEIEDALERDNFFTSEAALAFGLIDKVIEKRAAPAETK